MDFFGFGIPVGRYFGISVRLHFTFLIYAWWRVRGSGDPLFSLFLMACVFFCILLHEFGHALAARWCDGEAHDILIWPLGGLAFVRPAFNPTAHLITTVAGPFVTFVLWIVLGAAARLMFAIGILHEAALFLSLLSAYNYFILLFNLIPAFPMDGGRIVRDTLWHWMSAESATRIAVNISRFLALLAVLCVLSPPGVWLNMAIEHGVLIRFASYMDAISGNYYFLLFPLFIFMQTMSEQHIIALESGGIYAFSIRERLSRGQRQRVFREAMQEGGRVQAKAAFHKCSACGLTEVQSPKMDFRVCTECSNGQEYCRDHIDSHTHS